MDYQEPEAPLPDPEEKWALDEDLEPLVNILTFGWTEGDTIIKVK